MDWPQTPPADNGDMAVPPNQPVSDSDWEYEYDPDETEDFYFTLDLPPTTLEPAPKRRKANGKPAAGNEASLASASPQYIANTTTASQQSHDHPRQGLPLRITGLHTTTPSVEYDDQRYECRWTTDLGTQFHVSRPGLVKRPHRKGHAVDVVALSRVRLTGRHVIAPSSRPDSATGASAGGAIVLDEEESGDEAEEDGSVQPATPVQDRRQTPFLQRIAEIQRRKKEQSVNDGPPATSLSSAASAQPAEVSASLSYAETEAAPSLPNQPTHGEETVSSLSRPSQQAQVQFADNIPPVNGQDGFRLTDVQHDEPIEAPT